MLLAVVVLIVALLFGAELDAELERGRRLRQTRGADQDRDDVPATTRQEQHP